MLFWPAARKYLRYAVAAAVAYAGWTFVYRHLGDRRVTRDDHEQAAQAEFDRTYGGSAVRILQFYVREATVIEGQSTLLCYGVLNARSLRIEPPVSGVSVSLNRCLELVPQRDTRYTLTAEGTDGRVVSASLEVAVKPDVTTLPKIAYFRVSAHRIEQGQHIYLIEFGQQNGDEVSIDPPAFPTLHGSPFGRFYVTPRETTTYTLTVAGKRGHKVQRQLTVEVPQS